MKRAISSFILRLFGWTVEVDVPDYPECVICVAPHTSNWDVFIGKLAYLSIGRYAGFMMKKEWFFPPLGSLLTSMGGVPVSRDRRTDMVSQLVPIVLAYIDYKDKEVGIKKVFMPTGDVEKDMRMIKSYYKSFHARRPENFVTGL